MVGICDGLTVVEIGAGSVAASMAGMVFADAGARVIKVEPPQGDRLREQNPSGFRIWNRGKESLIADLRARDGQQQLRSLVADADVVIEGFAPGRASTWGVGAKDLREGNARLVHCSITGFGPIGGYSHLKSYDSLVAAKAGLWARGAFGHRDGPLMFPVPWGSFGAAMQAVAGIVGALLIREETGRGQALDATMVNGLDPIDYFVATIVQLMAKRGEPPSGDARSATASSRFGVLLATKDGRFIQTSTLLPHQGKALCDVAGLGQLVDDPRFSRLPMFDTPELAQEWEDQLVEAFRKQDLEHWLPLLVTSPDIAFEVAVTSEEGLDHPQLAHNGDVITIDDPEVGPIRQVGPIGHYSATPMAPGRPAPALGTHHGPLIAAAEPAHRGGEVPAHPFAGVTVVEFGCFYAMPYAAAMLASLGARVIKIEDANGDPHRNSFGPEVATNKTTAGKESLSIDLRSKSGQELARKVIANADVFLTGFRSGVAERLGLGEAELRKVNPRLLYVHAAGYGTDGPYASRALYAQAAQAVAGSFGRQVGYWSAPERNVDMIPMELQAVVLPRLAQIIDGDSNAALAALAAIALGIYHQARTGEGQRLNTSMIAGNAWAYSDDFCTYAGKPPTPLCDDEYFGTSAVQRVYQASEGTWVALDVQTDKELAALREAVGGELGRDARFATRAGCAQHDRDLYGVLRDVFASRPAADWEADLSKVGVGCVSVNMQGQAPFTSFDPVLRETGLTVTVEHPLFGEMVRAAPPVAFSETPGRVAPACIRGEHNRAILHELGYGDDAIAALEADGIVIPPG
jgi:crotonobetainyl-CoA:carnitine CoA-transferase CaiB-like acyl-CoA transferase